MKANEEWERAKESERERVCVCLKPCRHISLTIIQKHSYKNRSKLGLTTKEETTYNTEKRNLYENLERNFSTGYNKHRKIVWLILSINVTVVGCVLQLDDIAYCGCTFFGCKTEPDRVQKPKLKKNKWKARHSKRTDGQTINLTWTAKK